jgi:hypothetical protein
MKRRIKGNTCYMYRISHGFGLNVNGIQRSVLKFLSLGEGIGNTQRIGYKLHENRRFFLSHSTFYTHFSYALLFELYNHGSVFTPIRERNFVKLMLVCFILNNRVGIHTMVSYPRYKRDKYVINSVLLLGFFMLRVPNSEL